MQAVEDLKRRGYKPLPLRRIHIPKRNGGRRPLSIPCMIDRAMQALYLLALEPVAEQGADPNSYGFRKARSIQDAHEQCFIVLAKGNAAQWVLDADIEACLDHATHYTPVFGRSSNSVVCDSNTLILKPFLLPLRT